MSNFSARELTLVCVLGVTAACSGCYRPAAGKTGSTGGSASAVVVAMPAAPAPTAPAATAGPTPSPTAPAAATPSPTAAPSGTPSQLASSVDAALSRPLPYGAAATGGTPVASRSPSRSPRTKVLSAPQAAGGVLGITFDELVFPMEKDQPFEMSLLTGAVRGLFDKKIKIRGYIHPSCPFQTGVTSFILVRDDQSCCFGPGAALYDCIIVNMVPGRTTNFTAKPIAVEGVLTFREFKGLDGKHLAIYHLDGEAVE